jgi:hypothetical protein
MTFEIGYEDKKVVNPESINLAELKTDKDFITAYNELSKARHWGDSAKNNHGKIAGEMARQIVDEVRTRLERVGHHAHIFAGGSCDCNCRRDVYLHAGFGTIELSEASFSSENNIDLTDEDLFNEDGSLMSENETMEKLRERIGEPKSDLDQMVEDGDIEQETADIVKEIMEAEGLDEVTEVDEDNKTFTSGNREYTWMDSEDDAEVRARESLEDDTYLWKEAVQADNTTLGFDDWVDYVLNMDGWASVINSYDGSYETLKDGQVYWRSN